MVLLTSFLLAFSLPVLNHERYVTSARAFLNSLHFSVSVLFRLIVMSLRLPRKSRCASVVTCFFYVMSFPVLLTDQGL